MGGGGEAPNIKVLKFCNITWLIVDLLWELGVCVRILWEQNLGGQLHENLPLLQVKNDYLNI